MIFWELLYKIITRFRNYLYDKNIFKSYISKSYVISIGNIIAGGTGKTPLIIYLAELLKNSGVKVGIIAGGYKRKSKGLIVVHDNNKIATTVEKSGDEAYLLAEKLKIPILIHNKKYLALSELDNLFDIDVVLIDDGFQHRKISRNLDIVIINDKTIKEFNLIPKGYLREEKSNLKRADILIYRDLDVELEEFKSIKSFHIKTDINKAKIDDEKAIILTAIANPSNFVNFLNKYNANIEKVFAFKDHHFFKNTEIDKVIDFISTKQIKIIYTTEKDKIKLNKFNEKFESSNIKLICIELEITFNNDFEFKEYILGKINEENNSN